MSDLIFFKFYPQNSTDFLKDPFHQLLIFLAPVQLFACQLEIPNRAIDYSVNISEEKGNDLPEELGNFLVELELLNNTDVTGEASITLFAALAILLRKILNLEYRELRFVPKPSMPYSTSVARV